MPGRLRTGIEALEDLDVLGAVVPRTVALVGRGAAGVVSSTDTEDSFARHLRGVFRSVHGMRDILVARGVHQSAGWPSSGSRGPVASVSAMVFSLPRGCPSERNTCAISGRPTAPTTAVTGGAAAPVGELPDGR